MSPTIIAAVIAAMAALTVPMLAAVLAYRNELVRQSSERSAERETVRNAVDAEVRRVVEIVNSKRKWLDERPQDPMNWLPIRTPLWSALAERVGLLEPGRAGDLARFFGLVSWSNDVLELRKDPSAYANPNDFLHAYRAAIEAASGSVPGARGQPRG